MEHYLITKRNKVVRYATIQINLGNIMLIKEVLSYLQEMSRKGKSKERESRVGVVSV
jgi:hypothetical protein